ncbi:MAG: hypothetical protein PF485_13905 [Bacteroidales bacterium]|jgi:hypothetical protein|nr:hypothetical protein [Bacteroidales bacterium]
MYRFFLLSVFLFFSSNCALIGQIVYPDEDSIIVDLKDTISVKDTINMNDTLTVGDTVDVNTEDNKEIPQNTDIIYLHSGEKRYVTVKKIYLNLLYFSLPGNSKVEKMDQRNVYKIEYTTGKIEILNEEKPKIRKSSDWKKVKITKEKNNVVGLIEVARIEAKAEGSERGYSTPESLERSATIILKRKAALVNAHIVLVIEKKAYFAFGEIPSTTITGIAYRYK